MITTMKMSRVPLVMLGAVVVTKLLKQRKGLRWESILEMMPDDS